MLGVFTNFPLYCYLWETIVAICEFDVGSGLVGEGVVSLETSKEKNVWPIARWAYA